MHVLGDVYSCISSYADTSQADHAKCCVNLAIDLNDFLKYVTYSNPESLACVYLYFLNLHKSLHM